MNPLRIVKRVSLWLSEWVQLRKLNRELSTAKRVWSAFEQSERFKNMSPGDKHNEEGRYWADIEPLIDDIEYINTKRLLRAASRYGVPIPSSHDKSYEDLWQDHYEGSKYLTTAGKHRVRTLIRNERIAKRSEWIWWIPPTVAVLSALVAFGNFREARKERIKADEAYRLTLELSEKIEKFSTKVKQIAESTTELIAHNLAWQGRWIDKETNIAVMEEAREKILTILREIGTDENKVTVVVQELDKMIDRDRKQLKAENESSTSTTP